MGNKVAPALCEQLPYIVDHGVRQVRLIETVFSDDVIKGKLPDWLKRQQFGQAVLVADAGLAFVPLREVERVHRNGPKNGNAYSRHPYYGYVMTRPHIDPNDASSQFIAAFIARHHAIQARNQYGPGWQKIDSSLICPAQVDLAVTLGKPFDYFDDYFTRLSTGAETYAEQAIVPYDWFTSSFGALLRNNLGLVYAMESEKVDPGLPNLIARKILDAVLDTSGSGIGEVYRQLRPDLALLTSATAR